MRVRPNVPYKNLAGQFGNFYDAKEVRNSSAAQKPPLKNPLYPFGINTVNQPVSVIPFRSL